jgi:hypothetical protein
MNGVRIASGVRDFSLLHSVSTDFGAHQASYSMDICGSPEGIKRPKGEADHSTLSSVELKNGGAILPLLHTI